MDIDLTISIWNNFEFKICAEGGANRLYDQLNINKRPLYIPDYIVGDLDSIRDEVKEYYRFDLSFFLLSAVTIIIIKLVWNEYYS
jgi:thiamine pyrophosphokinase